MAPGADYMLPPGRKHGSCGSRKEVFELLRTRTAVRTIRPAAACRSLARPRGGSVFIFLPRPDCAVTRFYFFTARSLYGGNHVLLLPRSSCAVLDFNSSAAQIYRACAAADLTGRHRADDPTRRTFCRTDPVMRFIFNLKSVRINI